MKIVFFGTPAFAADVLGYLIANKMEVAAVITKPDRPKGRSGTPVPTPVKLVAEKHAIPYFQPPIVSDPAFAPILEGFHADLFVVVAYGEIIKQHLLYMPKLGCINLHASLLPKYRGAAPIQRSIINGDPVTGITVMHMVRKMDAGDIIKKAEVPIGPNDKLPHIEQQLCVTGSKVLLEVIRDFSHGKIQGEPQDHSQATHAPKIELEDCQLDWNKSASELHNLVRGVFPEPGAWCYIYIRGEKKRLKVFETRVSTGHSGAPGEIVSYGKNGLIIACGQNSLHILDLQPEGKKAMSAEEFMRGFQQANLSFGEVV
jgi:methionyl-tRNA formyltransferase